MTLCSSGSHIIYPYCLEVKLSDLLLFNLVINFKCNEGDLLIIFLFTSGFPTNTAILKFITELYPSLDNGGKVIGEFMDVSKAFDCINHKLLIQKSGEIAGVALGLT